MLLDISGNSGAWGAAGGRGRAPARLLARIRSAIRVDTSIGQTIAVAVLIWGTFVPLALAPPLVEHRLSPVVVVFVMTCDLVAALLSIAFGLFLGRVRRLAREHTRTHILVVIIAVLAATLALSATDRWLTIPFTAWVTGDTHLLHRRLSLYLMDMEIYVTIFASNAMCLYLLEANRAVAERNQQVLEAHSAARQARLAALRHQLSPHFLFNTLNALSALVAGRRTRDAELMIERLSDFLRSTLASGWREEVTLREELDVLEAYLDIEAVRFPDRLRFEVEAPDDLLDALVPNLILQPLAENSVKYAVAPSRESIRLAIKAERRGDILILVVEDSGRAAPPPANCQGARVGLENVRRRLHALYAGQGDVAFTLRSDGAATAIQMPLSYAPAADSP